MMLTRIKNREFHNHFKRQECLGYRSVTGSSYAHYIIIVIRYPVETFRDHFFKFLPLGRTLTLGVKLAPSCELCSVGMKLAL
jgi:hypothetical protein